jgi:Uma2 family endonuclease
MTLLEKMLHSPRLPQYVDELKVVLAAERTARERFINELREDQKAEFINGEVIVQSPVTLEHENSSSLIYKLFSVFVDVHELGYVAHEKVLISLTRNDYEPDVCYFGPEKAADLKRDQMRFPAPDLIVEVLSKSTEKTDRTIKFEDYAAHGVAEYWIVDPRKRTIEQYLLAGEKYELASKSKATIRSRAIKGFEMPVRAAFDAKANLKALKQILGASS